MSTDNNDKTSGLLANPLPIVMVVLLAAGVLAKNVPLESARPIDPERVKFIPTTQQDVEARLWQDPFAAVEKHENHFGQTAMAESTIKVSTCENYKYPSAPIAKDPTAKDPTAKDPTAKDPTAKDPTAKDPTAKDPTAKDPTAKDPTAKDPTAKDPTAKDPTAKDPTAKELIVKELIVKESSTHTKEAHTIEMLCEFINPPINPPHHPIHLTVLAVSVFGGSFVEAAEYRRRSRFAVVSALGFHHYYPENSEAIGYFNSNLELGTPPLAVPFEWYRKETKEPIQSSVLVLWLNEDKFSNMPLDKLKTLFNSLKRFPTSNSLNVKLVGPAGSEMLANLVKGGPENSSSFQVFSSGATVSNCDLLLESGREKDSKMNLWECIKDKIFSN